jgi:hypothetical protein
MPVFLFTGFFKIDSYVLISLIYIFLILIGLLFIFIIVFTINKSRIEFNKKLWLQRIELIISQAIFSSDDEGEPEDITAGIGLLLQKSLFRQYLINELIHARKNLSGASTLNLVKLYESLELDKDSFKKLQSKEWHIKAKGIQELAIMEQLKYVKEIFRLTNYENELVRNEAQCALVNFYGFSGLRFLNVTTYPISQWQQIQLLYKLNGAKPKNFDGIKKWLQFPNESVKVFSLKLAAYFNLYDVYADVINCLQSPDLLVRLTALEYLKKMPQEDTPEKIISIYSFVNKKSKLLILDILKEVGSEKQMLFLLKQLHNSDDDIKVAAAKTLSGIHPLGASCLQTHLFADEYPWNAIFLQINNERAA